MGTLKDVAVSERLLTSSVLAQRGLPSWRPGNTSPDGKKPRPDVYRGRQVRAGYDVDRDSRETR